MFRKQLRNSEPVSVRDTWPPISSAHQVVIANDDVPIEVPVVAMIPARPGVAGIIMPIHWSVIAIPVIGVAVIVVAVMVTVDRA
jgi:hypothetical protein